jgi:hypothetical protein
MTLMLCFLYNTLSNLNINALLLVPLDNVDMTSTRQESRLRHAKIGI